MRAGNALKSAECLHLGKAAMDDADGAVKLVEIVARIPPHSVPVLLTSLPT